MKTKYGMTLIFWGILIAVGGSSTLGRMGAQRSTADLVAAIPFILFGILSAGYGFKLRRLAKRGVLDTREK